LKSGIRSSRFATRPLPTPMDLTLARSSAQQRKVRRRSEIITCLRLHDDAVVPRDAAIAAARKDAQNAYETALYDHIDGRLALRVSPDEGRALLRALGFPFRRTEAQG